MACGKWITHLYSADTGECLDCGAGAEERLSWREIIAMVAYSILLTELVAIAVYWML